MLSKPRDRPAILKFFKKAIESSGFPQKVNVDKSGSNTAALERISTLLFMYGLWYLLIDVRRVKYLNNVVSKIIVVLKTSRNTGWVLNPLKQLKQQLLELSCIECLKRTA